MAAPLTVDVAGGRVHVAGTAPIPPDGSPPPGGAYEQAALCLRIIGEALERAGSGFEHVVRTNIYVTDPGHWDEVARAHGETFGETRPAATCVVARLLDDAWKVEITGPDGAVTTMWIAAESRQVAKLTATLPAMNGAILTAVLDK